MSTSSRSKMCPRYVRTQPLARTAVHVQFANFSFTRLSLFAYFIESIVSCGHRFKFLIVCSNSTCGNGVTTSVANLGHMIAISVTTLLPHTAATSDTIPGNGVATSGTTILPQTAITTDYTTAPHICPTATLYIIPTAHEDRESIAPSVVLRRNYGVSDSSARLAIDFRYSVQSSCK